MEEPHAAWGRAAYALFFLLGFVLASDRRFVAAARRAVAVALALGLAAFAGAAFASYGDVEVAFVAYDGHALAARALFGASGWFVLVAIVGLSARTGTEEATTAAGTAAGAMPTRGVRAAAYLREATLPFYVLHQPLLVAVAFVVVTWSLPATAKYVVIVAATFVTIAAVYELAVRRWAVGRFLFGMPARR
jgi:glucans biosynthesis protein C